MLNPVEKRSALISRLYATFQAQMNAIEQRLELAAAAGDPGATATAEKDARTLATLVRTLEKLINLERTSAEDEDKPGGARNYRREILRRIESFAARRKPRKLSRNA